MEEEIWIGAVGWEDRYEVSNLGQIRSKARFAVYKNPAPSKGRGRTIHTKILTLWKHNRNGYLTAHLWKDNKLKIRDLHRIIALSFIPNPENKRCVNHKNGIKTDNRVANLEWNTHSENRVHSIETGLHDDRGERHTNAKLTKEQVLDMREMRKQGFLVREIHEKYPFMHKQYINLVVTKKRWKHV